jgi:predicted dehydrogenase
MRIGLLGYGNIAKKHLAAISELEQYQVVAIYDVETIEAPEEIKVYKDLSEFLAHDLDIVTVCSPNGFHKEHSLQALQAGHHVICEKPFALSTQACQEMIDVARQQERKIYCTMQNRFSPVSQWLQSLVENKQLGDLYLVNVACYWNRNKKYYEGSDWRGKMGKDGGTLFTQFSHYVDTLYWLFGPMQIHNAHFANFDHEEMIEFEDTGIFNFTFDRGGMGTFSYTTSCYEKNFESSLTLIGSQGTIKVGGQYMDRVDFCNVKGLAQPTLSDNDNLSNIRAIYREAGLDITGQKNKATSATDGLAVVQLIEAVYGYRTLV